MSRLALKQFCKDTLDGISSPPVPLLTYTQRPKETPIGSSAVVVVSLPETWESRMTAPRRLGQKQNDVRARLDVYWIAQDEMVSGDTFDLLLDAIDLALRGVTVPQTLTDPVTLGTSLVVFIAEDIKTQADEPTLDESIQGLVVFSASKVVSITEVYQG